MDMKDDGGQAFPSAGPVYQCGMTLRDYFAAKAMASMIAGASSGKVFGGDYQAVTIERNMRAAYLIADAMLRARK